MTDIWMRPGVDFLSSAFIEGIVAEAYILLETVGVQVESEEALDLLAGGGARIERDRAFLPGELVDHCRQSAPASVSLFDRSGALAGLLKDANTHFNPGSSALLILDPDGTTIRKPVSRDLVNCACLVDQLEYLAFQSTALISSDVPTEIADRYRLFIGLNYCQKPVITGTFSPDGFEVMYQMLCLVRGSEQALREKPLAVFDCCPTSPLQWSSQTVSDLIKAAQRWVPAEIVAMPLAGAAAPITLAGTLVQHTAENLSGIVIHQLAQAGAPVIYGGSPAIMDMRKGTTPMGAIETMMIESGHARIGKHLGFPVHAYLGLSDAKILDYQAGLETGIGAILAALSGINVVSGCGMLAFENCQSLEKLVLDNDIAGMALRLTRGITSPERPFAREFFEPEFRGNFLASRHTLSLFQNELYFPSPALDRATLQEWQACGHMGAAERANRRVESLLANRPIQLDPAIQSELNRVMKTECQKYGVSMPITLSS
ncbi:trimethylamine methyltransferase family protein [bacterium]|nr:trimethylamine methyltransferase family protein [bacterium]